MDQPDGLTVSERDELLDDRGLYKLLQLKPNARMSCFALIPDSAHFHIIENPAACADAIRDFVASVNEVRSVSDPLRRHGRPTLQGLRRVEPSSCSLPPTSLQEF
ncbi:alpha/beta fold hydrolase [Candidatus Poriferisodalis sp.]|uniref:alpha/beta fold hydrolase n=1 Tax=Candidatus Poriferisodalis sp. TaxID=3101277 RepID=UPI003C6FD679